MPETCARVRRSWWPYWLLATLVIVFVGSAGVRADAAPHPEWPEPRWASAEQLDRYLTTQRDELDLPGLAVVVINEGDVLFERAYGEASPGVPVTLETPFRLGSTSKQFTGLAIQQLIAQDKISLDTSVAMLLPEFREANAAWGRVTVRHLLAHRSGLSEAEGRAQFSPWPTATNLQDEARRLAGTRLRHPPGEQFEYTNAGYTVLGAIIERVTGVNYENALQELVARPLGLISTTGDSARASGNGLASGYYPWLGAVSLPTPAPAGVAAEPSAHLISTARDLTTLLKAHLGRPTDLNKEVLSAARQPLGAVDEHVDYASGWTVRGLWELTDHDDGWDDPDRPRLWLHEGSIARWLSSLAFSPDYGLGVVALTNTGPGTDELGWSNFTYDLLHTILGTQPLVWEPDILVRAAPAWTVGLPALQVVTAGWLASRRLRAGRRRWLPLAVGGLMTTLVLCLALIVVPSRSRLALVDPVWMVFVPDVAISVALMLLLSGVLLTLITLRLLEGGRRVSQERSEVAY